MEKVRSEREGLSEMGEILGMRKEESFPQKLGAPEKACEKRGGFWVSESEGSGQHGGGDT